MSLFNIVQAPLGKGHLLYVCGLLCSAEVNSYSFHVQDAKERVHCVLFLFLPCSSSVHCCRAITSDKSECALRSGGAATCCAASRLHRRRCMRCSQMAQVAQLQERQGSRSFLERLLQ